MMDSIKWHILTVFCSFLLLSCLNDDSVDRVIYDNKPITSIEIDNVGLVKEETVIRTYYTKTSNCEAFFNYEYYVNGNEREIILITSTVDKHDCEKVNDETYETLKFRPDERGVYLFKFWTGNDDQGKPVYITKEIKIN